MRERVPATRLNASSPRRRCRDDVIRRPEVKRPTLLYLQTRLPHRADDIPVPVTPPPFRVWSGEVIQYVAQPSVRLTATVLEQKDAPSVAFAADAPAAPRPSSADASHLAERRDGVLEATQAESVHHRVEGFVAEGGLGGVHDDGRGWSCAGRERLGNLGSAHLHHRLRAVRRGQTNALGVIREVTTGAASGGEGEVASGENETGSAREETREASRARTRA